MRCTQYAPAVLILVLALAAPAFAAKTRDATRPASPQTVGKEDLSPCGQFRDLTPEKRKALMAAFIEHRQKIYPLREQFWAKRVLLRALSNNQKTEPQQLTALVEELSALRRQIRAERLAFQTAVQKDFNITLPVSALGHDKRGTQQRGGKWGHGGHGMRRGMGFGPCAAM